MLTVVAHAATPASAACIAAVRRQTNGGAFVLAGANAGALAAGDDIAIDVAGVAGAAGALHAALPAALATGAEWLWVLDGRAVPQPEALAALLDTAGRDDLPRPGLLAGKVVLPGGDMHPDALPWPEIYEKEVSIAACAHRLVSLRAARPGSLLIRRDVVERVGGPRPDFVSHGEVLEWTARLLRDESGYLVPASVAVRADREAPDRRREFVNRARMLRGGAWRPDEKLWLAALLAEDVVRAATGRA
jgi:GT2 family glycosyltransferase